MISKRGVRTFSLAFFILCVASGCGDGGKGGGKTANPNFAYSEDEWLGVAAADYRNLEALASFGPFQSDEACIADIASGEEFQSDRSVFECCRIEYEIGERKVKCKTSFNSPDGFSEYGWVDCADPKALCNERGQTVATHIQDWIGHTQRDVERIEAAFAELVGDETDMEARKRAGEEFTRSLSLLGGNADTAIEARIAEDLMAQSLDAIEAKFVEKRDAARDVETREIFEAALTAMNLDQNSAALKDIARDAAPSIATDGALYPFANPVDVSNIPELKSAMPVDAVIIYSAQDRAPGISRNKAFEALAADEIAKKRSNLKHIGFIYWSEVQDSDKFYAGAGVTSIGSAYRIVLRLYAIDVKAGKVTGYKRLVGGPPPKETTCINGSCRGVGEPPDWKPYFSVVENRRLSGGDMAPPRCVYSQTLPESERLAVCRSEAESGFEAAQLALAYLYSLGDVVAKDEALANAWFERAAAQGNAEAAFALAEGLYYDLNETFLEEGKTADPEDIKQIIEWMTLATSNGNPSAHLYLGTFAEEGPDRDLMKAYMHYSIAARSDLAPTALEDAKRLAGQLSPEEIEKANKMAEGYTDPSVWEAKLDEEMEAIAKAQ